MDPNMIVYSKPEEQPIPALYMAVRDSADIRCVELLLDTQARVDLCDFPHRESPFWPGRLLGAVAGNRKIDPSVVQLLVEAKADLCEDVYTMPVVKVADDLRVLETPLLRNLDSSGQLVSEFLRFGMDAHHSVLCWHVGSVCGMF